MERPTKTLRWGVFAAASACARARLGLQRRPVPDPIPAWSEIHPRLRTSAAARRDRDSCRGGRGWAAPAVSSAGRWGGVVVVEGRLTALGRPLARPSRRGAWRPAPWRGRVRPAAGSWARRCGGAAHHELQEDLPEESRARRGAPPEPRVVEAARTGAPPPTNEREGEGDADGRAGSKQSARSRQRGGVHPRRHCARLNRQSRVTTHLGSGLQEPWVGVLIPRRREGRRLGGRGWRSRQVLLGE